MLCFLPAELDILRGAVGTTAVFVITNAVVAYFIAILAYSSL